MRRALAEFWGVFADPGPAQRSDRARLRTLEEEFEALAGELRSEWRTERRHLQGELDAMADLAETTERKRRRVAARESYQKKREEAEAEAEAAAEAGREGGNGSRAFALPTDREATDDELRRYARSVGALPMDD